MRINSQIVKIFSYGLSACFLLIHAALLIMFQTYGVVPMAAVNCFSILFYLFTGILIHKGLLRSYIIALYLEVLLHMGLAVYFTGWNSGFQITLLGMHIIAFYGEYVTRTLKQPHPHALLLSLLALGEYILLYVITTYHTEAYPLPDRVSFWLQILWGIVVFVIGASCLHYFVRVTTHTESILATEAETDHLTGLYNRAGYDRIIEKEDISSVILLLMDGDHFKEINDSYGHTTGDLVLKRIANTLTDKFRSEDRICRIGGDEFAVLIHSDKNIHQQAIIHKITEINRELSVAEDRLPPISISVGCAEGAKCTSRRELVTKADQALYQVKASGGCGCVFFTGNT